MYRFPAKNRLFTVVAISTVVAAVSGCGDSAPMKGVPVAGTITLNGQPLADADVSFLNSTYTGYGRTDTDGYFRLVQGAVPGENRIVVSKLIGDTSMIDEDPESGMDMGQFDAAAMEQPGNAESPSAPVQLVPSGFSNPAETKLTYNVPPEGATDIVFDL